MSVPVGRGVLGPEFEVDGRRGPNDVEQMVDPTLFSIDFLLEFGSVAFDGFGIRGLSVDLFLLRWEFEECLPDSLQMGDCLIWDVVVDDLKHAPIARSVVDGSDNRVFIWVFEIDDGNSEELAFDGGDSGLLGVGADELSRETTGEERRGSDVLDPPDLHLGKEWVCVLGWEWDEFMNFGEGEERDGQERRRETEAYRLFQTTGRSVRLFSTIEGLPLLFTYKDPSNFSE